MSKLQNYAKMAVELGANVQKGQPVFINSQIETAEFARIVAEEAYKVGASEVHVSWADDKLSRIQHMNNSDSVYESFPMWRKEYLNHYANKGAAYIHISASDPEALKGVDTSRLAQFQIIANKELKNYRSKMMNNELRWCIVSVPTVAWAKKVFPSLSDDKAVEALWDAIYNATRMNESDPIAAWKKHIEILEDKSAKLNDFRFEKLHYSNSLGTDLFVGLVEDHKWDAAGDYDPNNIRFLANMPTEEVYTMPDAYNVEGVVYSSKPLVYNGNIIDEFYLKFEKGLVVDFGAKVGESVLKEMLDIDEGAKRLGEVALVPYDSPISNSNILFFNTLFDENASCHFAVGAAYGTNIKNGSKLTDEEKKKVGMNDSAIHEDFMVGTSDLKIVGYKKDGSTVEIFKDGNFCI